MEKTKDILILYVIMCFIGAILEGAYGMLWSLSGQTPWIYPDSIFKYTSLETLPLWGLAGLICATIYRAYSNRSWKVSAGIIPIMAIAAIWIVFYGFVIQ